MGLTVTLRFPDPPLFRDTWFKEKKNLGEALFDFKA